MTEAARPTVFIDNDTVRVTEWRFAPGAATGWHRHEFRYVVVPVTDGTLLLRTPEGDREAPLKLGVPYFREAGVEHDVINGGSAELAFIEIEVK